VGQAGVSKSHAYASPGRESANVSNREVGTLYKFWFNRLNRTGRRQVRNFANGLSSGNMSDVKVSVPAVAEFWIDVASRVTRFISGKLASVFNSIRMATTNETLNNRHGEVARG